MHYFTSLLKHKRVIASATLAAAVFAVALSLALPSSFRSTALILPPEQDQGLMGAVLGQAGAGMAGLAGSLLGGSSADMYVSILNSNAVADRIIDRFKLMEHYRESYRCDTYRALARRVDIGVGKKDGIISITVEDRDPKLASEMANAFVAELDRVTARLNISAASQNREFLEQRLSLAKADCAKAEDALKAFQTRSKLVDVESQAAASISGVGQLKAQLVQQELQLVALRRQFTDDSQEVKNAKASVAHLRGQLSTMESGAGGALPRLGGVPRQQLEYLRLMRDLKSRQSLVELLTSQYELAKLSEANGVTNLQVIQKARVADKKAKPRRAAVVLLVTLAACFGAALYACWVEAWGRIPEQERRRWKALIRKAVA